MYYFHEYDKNTTWKRTKNQKNEFLENNNRIVEMENSIKRR